ncbi:MAG: heat shock protein Hsp20 [Verrucomicrobiales bacterium]|nr:heat shock protein Hsp20 [Verrucomicrobiales bacterium]
MNTVTETQNRSALASTQSGRGFVIPPANIAATEHEYIVEVDMPGVTKEGLEVTVEGNELTIIGRRASDVPEGELCYCETAQTDFKRVFELGPDVDTSRITAEMKQGVLKLRLAKSEKTKPKQIDVKVA